MVKLLLEYNANVDTPNAKGYTPLMIACDEASALRAVGNDKALRYEEVMRILVDNDADINRSADDGDTALTIAEGKPNLVAILTRGEYTVENVNVVGTQLRFSLLRVTASR